MDKEFKKVYAGIHKNLKNKKWNCLYNSCQNTSINSHLLQQNGVLNTIAEKGHLIEVKPVDVFKWSQKQSRLEFKRVGVRQALSLDVFCSHHDSELFKSVETIPIDYSNIENQVLLSYRTICAEIKAKMINSELETRLRDSKTLAWDYSRIKKYNLAIEAYAKAMEDLNTYKTIMECAIDNKDYSKFEFNLFQYPLIEVYCSACFTPYESLQTGLSDNVLNHVFIHIIPYGGSLNIIVGYHKEHVTDYIKEYASSWSNLKMEELGIKLTNLFATKVINWGLSPQLYKKMNPGVVKKHIDYFYQNLLNHLQSQEVEFNLFSNIL